MTDNPFPGRSALAAFGDVSDDWMEGYRKGFMLGTVGDGPALAIYEVACQTSVAVSAGGMVVTPQGVDLEIRNRAVLDRLLGLRDGFEAGRDS